MSNKPNKEDLSSRELLQMQAFRSEQKAGNHQVIFNTLDGQRSIKKAHSHDFFVIILFDKGKGIHTIDMVDYPIGNKEVHVLFPDQLHKWEIGSSTKAYQLMVERSFFERFAPYFRFSFTNYQNNPVIKLDTSTYNLLLYEFEAILNELENSDVLLDIIRARAGVIAAILSKQAQGCFSEFKVYQSNTRLAEFNMLIDKFYKEHKNVGFYAQELHITANYLNVLCKKHLKLSANSLITSRVVLQAKRLLENTDLSIKEISQELGFVDQAYFSHVFKNHTSLSPSDFRINR